VHQCCRALDPPPQKKKKTPDKEVEIKNISVYVSGYTVTDTTGMLYPPTVWCQQSEFVSSRQSGQIRTAARKVFECRWNGRNCCRFKCSHAFLQCIPRQMLVCCCVGAGSNVAVLYASQLSFRHPTPSAGEHAVCRIEQEFHLSQLVSQLYTSCKQTAQL
jgi:hypothetical protein